MKLIVATIFYIITLPLQLHKNIIINVFSARHRVQGVNLQYSITQICPPHTVTKTRKWAVRWRTVKRIFSWQVLKRLFYKIIVLTVAKKFIHQKLKSIFIASFNLKNRPLFFGTYIDSTDLLSP